MAEITSIITMAEPAFLLSLIFSSKNRTKGLARAAKNQPKINGISNRNILGAMKIHTTTITIANIKFTHALTYFWGIPAIFSRLCFLFYNKSLRLSFSNNQM